MSIPEIASELGVDAVIEASVSCIDGDSICIQIRLVSAFPDEQQLWVGNFHEEKSQILNLYNRVTKQISEEINIVLTPQEENLLTETKTVNTEAYEAYLKGKYYWDQLTPEGLQKAMEYFNLAIEIDPEWAPPYAGIAEFWIGMRQMGLAPSSVTIPNIYKYLDKTNELDPNSANTLYVNGLASIWTGFDWQQGEEDLLKVLKINPNDAYAHAYYAHLLMFLKRMDEALVHSGTSLELDPLNPLMQGLNAVVLMHAGEHNNALAQAEKVVSAVPGHPLAMTVLWISNYELGNYPEAIQAMTQRLSLDNETSTIIQNTYNEHGHIAAIEAVAEYLEQLAQSNDTSSPSLRLPAIRLVWMYLELDNLDRAMDWLEHDYEIRGPALPYSFTGAVVYQKLEDNSRYIELLKKMNLPPGD